MAVHKQRKVWHRSIRKDVKRVSWAYTDHNDEVPTHAEVSGSGSKVYVDRHQLLVNRDGTCFAGMVFESGGFLSGEFRTLSELFQKYTAGDSSVLFFDVEAWNALTASDIRWINSNKTLRTLYVDC
jgi:hypothetical protein